MNENVFVCAQCGVPWHYDDRYEVDMPSCECLTSAMVIVDDRPEYISVVPDPIRLKEYRTRALLRIIGEDT